MPKICKRRQPHGQQVPRGVFSQARKVSFEEASHSSSAASLKSSHSSSDGMLIPRTSPCTNMFLMSALLERKPTPPTSLSDMATTEEEEDSLFEIRSRTVSQEEDECTSSSSPWGQFVDVIPHDDVCWTTPSYVPPVLHSSPTYHPYYMKNHSTKKKSTAGLPSIPTKKSPTRKLQPRSSPLDEAFEQLRF